MTFNDLLKKEEFSKFKLVQADYDENKDETVLTFLYPENENSIEELKEKLKQEATNALGDVGACKFKFKQSYIDEDLLFSNLTFFENQEFPYLKGLIAKEDLHIKKENGLITITIDCDDEVNNILTKYDFSDCFSKFLKDKYYEDVKFIYNVCKQPKQSGQTEELSSAAELLKIYEEEEKLNKVEVSEVVNIYGKEIKNLAKFIKDIPAKGDIVVAGKISKFLSSKYVPKSQKNLENPLQKPKITFLLEDASGSIEIVVFPSEKEAEKLSNLSDGVEVVVEGSLSFFSDRKNIMASSISVCKILTKEVQYIWREPIKEYTTVKPKPMVDLKQMDLFSAFEQKNSYWDDGKSVVVFDFETTGLNADNCEIIEIGAVKVTNGVCCETFSTLVNPNQKLPLEITNITGITDEMLVFAPTIDKVLPDFHKFCQGCVLSAYNIGFDIKFLKNAGLKFRYKFDNPQIDTLELARQKIASLHNYKLSSVVKALNITLNEAHRALNDAIATAKVFIKLI